MQHIDVLVIGAGLAGLRCADVLASAGRDVMIWEADEAVGGRVRTDIIDGFRCDRGFQVLNPAYPELRRAVNLSALRLQHFEAGIVVRKNQGHAVYAHPLRAPARLPEMLMKSTFGPRDLLAAARWVAPALRPKSLKSLDYPDSSLWSALERAGVHGELRRVIERFMAGVLLEEVGASSNAFALLLARSFGLGVPALPADGMHAIPKQLAQRLPERILLNHPAKHISADTSGWRVSNEAATVRARHVVVATDPQTASTLTNIVEPIMRGVVTDWWVTDDPPEGPPMLWIDGRPIARGPVLNTAVISLAAPTYAPEGRHLIAASALLDYGGAAPSEALTRRHATDILGVDGRKWDLLIRHVVRDALPAQPPPLSVQRPVRVSNGLWLCGDHRDTASIQGALVSGRRTAKEILREGC